jgi:hypothetical protein
MIIKKFLFFLVLSFFFLSSVYSASYTDPTPEDGAKLWKETLTIKVLEEGSEDISDCFLRINGTIDEVMTYTDPYCEYNLSGFPDAKATWTYQVFYDGTNENLAERSFDYYPKAVENQIPAFGLGSLAIALTLVLIGGFLRR